MPRVIGTISLHGPPVKAEAAKSIAVLAIGRSGHGTKSIQIQHLADEFSLRRRRARLIAALLYGEPRHDA